MSEQETVQDPGPTTVSLGRFDPLELPLILDVLHEHGIFAMTKSPLDKAEAAPYAVFSGEREILLVESERADEARRLIETEVRQIASEMSGDLATDGESVPENLVPFGWLEPEVAREFIAQLAASDIAAAPEYPLDAPPPPYARADGRVRVHVEEMLVDKAWDVLETDVREALAARGITPAEPLVEEDS
ncbi:MAG: hypothetical protein WAT66_02805 [Actinomycetota bacterium]